MRYVSSQEGAFQPGFWAKRKISSDLRSNDHFFLRASWLKRAKAMSAALWITKPKGGGKGRKIAETCVFKQINKWNMGMIFSHISMEIIYYL